MSSSDPVLIELMSGLTATPDVLERLLKSVEDGSPVWDFTPDQSRFTLREIVAHLADWEGVLSERIRLIRDEHEPDFPSVNENQMAIDNDYAHADPRECLAQFRARRIRLMQMLENLPPEGWTRIAKRHFGPITLANQAILILGHDGYHLQQVAQWLELQA